MSKPLVYSCQCLNIRIYLASKYMLDTIEEQKKQHAVNEPLFGWELELGMGGLHIEYTILTHTQHIQKDWNTVSCLNCNTDNIYSILSNISNQHNKIIIHSNAVCDKLDQLKQESDYSFTFNINLNNKNMEESIPMPDSTKDIPDHLISTYKQIKSTMDQSIEQLRIESKVRIEQFKKEEEKRLQDQIARAQQENSMLWTRLMNVSIHEKMENDHKLHHNSNHVRFALEERQPSSTPSSSSKRLSFALDESAMNRLKSVNLKQYQDVIGQEMEDEERDDDEEEDMFHLDEELSEEEEKEEDLSHEIEASAKNVDTQKADLLLSSSLKKSISEIDQRFSWVKKKKNTSKYISKDFDIKTEPTKDILNDKPISLFATSVPISIHYLPADEDNQQENSPRKQDILASSFANYDSSFSDRMLSSQFPAPQRRRSLASSSRIRPQLDTLAGKSLDTRGLRRTYEAESHASDDEFDSTVPPHVWAASIDEH